MLMQSEVVKDLSVKYSVKIFSPFWEYSIYKIQRDQRQNLLSKKKYELNFLSAM